MKCTADKWGGGGTCCLLGHYRVTSALWGLSGGDSHTSTHRQTERASVWLRDTTSVNVFAADKHAQIQEKFCNAAPRILNFVLWRSWLYKVMITTQTSQLQSRNRTHLRKHSQLSNTDGIRTPESCPLLLYNSDEPPNSILLKTSSSPPFFSLPLTLSLSHKHTQSTQCLPQSLAPPPPSP